MEFQTIGLEIKNQIAYITIQRAGVLNALNHACVKEMKAALESISNNQGVLCVVFSGEGEKAFAAGADIEELSQLDTLDMLASNGMQEIFTYIHHFEKPTIAKIKGFALGGGGELALACDIRIAAENAKFGFPELNLAILPGAGGTQRLARLIGEGPALHLILTGEMIRAERALQLGLVSEVCSLEAIDAKVDEIAANIAAKGPVAARLAKLAVKQGGPQAESGLMIEKLAQAILFQSNDKREGMSAFIEKRKAQFEGR